MKNTDLKNKLTLKEFTEKYLPPEFAKRKVFVFPQKRDYAKLGKNIVDEIRRDLKI